MSRFNAAPSTAGAGSRTLSGRGKSPATVSGTGHTDAAALVDLHQRLTGMARPADDAARRESINRRLRQAFYQGAEEEASRGGRPLDEVELSRVIARYPGDI